MADMNFKLGSQKHTVDWRAKHGTNKWGWSEKGWATAVGL